MILLVRGIESVDIGGQAEVVNACIFTVNSSLFLTQFEALFFLFQLMEHGSVQTIILTILLQEKH